HSPSMRLGLPSSSAPCRGLRCHFQRGRLAVPRIVSLTCCSRRKREVFKSSSSGLKMDKYHSGRFWQLGTYNCGLAGACYTYRQGDRLMGRQLCFWMSAEDELAFCQHALTDPAVVMLPDPAKTWPPKELSIPLRPAADHFLGGRDLLLWNRAIFAKP